MNTKIAAAVGVVAALAAGGVVYAVTADDENGRKAAIGDTGAGSVAYVASTGTDSGTCSTAGTACATVTYALTKVNAGATINVSGTIHDHPVVSTQVTISGAEAPAGSPAVIDGSNTPNTSVVRVASGYAATLDHLRIEHGANLNGAGIRNGGRLTLNHVTVADNVADASGGGIYTTGALTINDSTLTGNSSGSAAYGGGGIFAERSVVTITDTTISGNTANGTKSGGGIYVRDVRDPNNPLNNLLTLLRSTVSGNKAGDYGGGILAYNMKVISSTIAGNTAPFGGGIWAVGYVTVTASTIVGNNRQGINAGTFGSVIFGSSIIAQNIYDGGFSNCAMGERAQDGVTPFISSGYNLTEDTGTACALTKKTDVRNVIPGVKALANNGGPTKTMSPTGSSPARNRVPTGTTLNETAVCPGTDQRGIARPKSGATTCTIGSVEP